jgi:quercetin dioxygenase-like cupin family protein
VDVTLVGAGGAVLGTCEPDLATLSEIEGEPAVGVRVWSRDVGPSRIEVIELDVGARLPMHAGPHFATCQVVRGRGKLGLPDGDVPFDGPALFTFEAGADHSWHSIEEPTVMTTCVVTSPAG